MATQTIEEKSSFREAFEDFAGKSRDGEPSWLARLREGAFERFEEAGFPVTDEEDWKYTNVAPIARQAFRPAALGVGATPDLGAVEPFLYAEARRSRLVFVNGFFRPDLSSLEAIPSGVIAADLADALTGAHADVVRENLARLSGQGGDAFAALNTAFHGGGAFLYVPAGVKVEAPVQLLFLHVPAGAES